MGNKEKATDSKDPNKHRRNYEQKNATWQNHRNNCYKQELTMDVKISSKQYDREYDIYKIARYFPTRQLLITKGKMVPLQCRD